MSLQVKLLEESFAAFIPRGNELANAFYRNLFADFPQVQPLFENVKLPEQKKKLLASLKLAIENLHSPKTLVPALEQLGSRHVDYGALEEHYPAVGQTLLKSLAEVGGDIWNDELHAAWAGAFCVISNAMLSGAALPA